MAEIKVWQKGESLEDLVPEQIAQMCNSSDYIDGHFNGLFVGEENEKFVFLYRGEDDVVLKWKLSGRGYLHSGYFLFDGFEENFENITKEDKDYELHNQNLKDHNL